MYIIRYAVGLILVLHILLFLSIMFVQPDLTEVELSELLLTGTKTKNFNFLYHSPIFHT